MIDKYIQAFSNLRTDKNRNRWSPLTCHQAPHKPFLLMSVMDHFAQGVIAENFIEPSFELVETWNVYWNAIMPIGHRSTMAHPFPRLKTDKFWHLKTNAGFDPQHDYNVTSMAKCREIYVGASLDDELFQYMCDPNSREQLRAVLVQRYFVPEIQPKVVEQGFVNIRSYGYAKSLVGKAGEQIDLVDKEPEEKKKRIRDAGFRKAIVTLYEHRCALCGIRMLTPEGHTVVEAAHIVPWSESQDDHPTNGLCLCRLCHWSFDEGLMSVGKQYEVLISKRVQSRRNIPGHMQTLMDRPIFKPDNEIYWPAQDNLKWHKRERFTG